MQTDNRKNHVNEVSGDTLNSIIASSDKAFLFIGTVTSQVN